MSAGLSEPSAEMACDTDEYGYGGWVAVGIVVEGRAVGMSVEGRAAGENGGARVGREVEMESGAYFE